MLIDIQAMDTERSMLHIQTGHSLWVIQLVMKSCYNLLGLGTIPQIMYIEYVYGGIMKQIITIGQLMFQNYVNDITFPFTRGIPIA